jgi:hypothetical protein
MSFKKLHNVMHEQILTEWTDEETGMVSTLGSCSLTNKQTTDFFMKVGIDPKTEHINIYLSLVVSVGLKAHSRKKEVLLIFLPHVFPTKDEQPTPFECLNISSVRKLSFINSSIIQQADLTHSRDIVRVQFTLSSKGCVVVPKTNNVFKPKTRTAHDLLLGLQSLANASKFNVYMRQSDYAIAGLRKLNWHLHNCRAGPLNVDLEHLYDGRPAMFLDWSHIEQNAQQPKPKEKEPPLYANISATQLKDGIPQLLLPRHEEQPPLYFRGSSISPDNVLNPKIPESPPITATEVTSQQPGKVVVCETPPRTLRSMNALAPTPRQSPLDGVLEFEQQLGTTREYPSEKVDLDEVRRRDGFGITGEEPPDEIDSDEEWQSMVHTRHSSPTPMVPSTPETLFLQFTTWSNWALSINKDLSKHQRLCSKLRCLGYYARTSNITAFNTTRIWCSTIIFYDPTDTPELWSLPSRCLISDIAQLVTLSNSFCVASEISSSRIRHEFGKMGNAARAVALKPGCAEAALTYQHQKALCFSLVYFEFGQPVVHHKRKRR